MVVTHYIQTYRTASGSISNGELIKYHRGRILFPSIHTMMNSTMPKFQVELRVL